MLCKIRSTIQNSRPLTATEPQCNVLAWWSKWGGLHQLHLEDPWTKIQNKFIKRSAAALSDILNSLSQTKPNEFTKITHLLYLKNKTCNQKVSNYMKILLEALQCRKLKIDHQFLACTITSVKGKNSATIFVFFVLLFNWTNIESKHESFRI